MRDGTLIILTAPSGTGKSTVTERVLAARQNLAFSVSHTTRPIRGDEVDGEDYHFVDEATFDAMVAAGERSGATEATMFSIRRLP